MFGIDLPRYNLYLKKCKAEHEVELEKLKNAHKNDLQVMRQNFENKFEACKKYYYNKMEGQRGFEKAQVAKEHSLLEALNQVLQQRLNEKEAEIARQKDEISFLKLERTEAGIYLLNSHSQLDYFSFLFHRMWLKCVDP